MAFEDIANRLAQVGAGWTVGTLEREKADRDEAQRMTTQAVQFGSQGIDLAPFFTPDSVRPANVPLLETLQSQSGGRGALQYPFERNLAVTAQREQTRYDVQQDMLDTRLDNQADLLASRQAAARTRSLRTLDANAWNELRDIIRQEVDPDLMQMLPDLYTTDARGNRTVTNPEDVATLGQIRRAIERRLPQNMPTDLTTIQRVIRDIWENQIRGNITATQSSGILPSLGLGTPRTFRFQDNAAMPAQPGATPTAGAVSLDTPGGITPVGTPGTVGQRDTGPAALTGRLLAQYNNPITQAAQEFNLPPLFVAAQIEAESRGRPTVSGPPPRDGGPPAYGLMQVRPGTYAEVAGRIRERRGITDPNANIRVGTGFMREMLDRYQGHYGLALAAYNWGPGNVDGLMSRMARDPNNTWENMLARMPAETRAYIGRIGNSIGGWSHNGSRPGTGDNQVQMAAAGGASDATGPAPRNVPQATPTPQDASRMTAYVDGLTQTIRRRIQSVTDYSQRAPERQRVLDIAIGHAQRNYPQYRDWVRAELERRLRTIR